MRALFTALGAKIVWDEPTRTVLATNGIRIVKVQIGSTRASIRGILYSLRTPATLHQGTTFVPLRFVSEALGAHVMWNEATKAIDIEYQAKPGPPATAEKVTVRQVIDGDTVQLEDGRHVRLIGVETTATVTPGIPAQRYGPQASEFTKNHLTGATVYLDYDVEKQDRLQHTLGYIWLDDGQLFNAILLREGYAQVATVPPNLKYADLFLKLQTEAREQQRGLWEH